MASLLDPDSGLSLCIQGTRTSSGGDSLRGRFIPVYTGNAKPGQKRLLLMAVYPCVYRERRFYVCHLLKNGGLSLCIQGTPCSSIL